jgi:hypothetical protein
MESIGYQVCSARRHALSTPPAVPLLGLWCAIRVVSPNLGYGYHLWCEGWQQGHVPAACAALVCAPTDPPPTFVRARGRTRVWRAFHVSRHPFYCESSLNYILHTGSANSFAETCFCQAPQDPPWRHGGRRLGMRAAGTMQTYTRISLKGKSGMSSS